MRDRIIKRVGGKDYLHLYRDKWLDLDPEMLYTETLVNGKPQRIPYLSGVLRDGFYHIVFEKKDGFYKHSRDSGLSAL